MLGRMERDEVCERFLETLPFEPYPFQEEALLTWFSTDTGAMLCAPTGMGKTLIAEAAVFEALHSGTRMYYTTPLIALTDQKFRELAGLGGALGLQARRRRLHHRQSAGEPGCSRSASSSRKSCSTT